MGTDNDSERDRDMGTDSDIEMDRDIGHGQQH
jgi:hypothetical protein